MWTVLGLLVIIICVMLAIAMLGRAMRSVPYPTAPCKECGAVAACRRDLCARCWKPRKFA